MNSYSGSAHLKSKASDLIESLFDNPLVTVVSSSRELFRQSLKTYRAFNDKGWSLVDCASFEIMRKRNITEALTHDHHFEQAGFVALLRN